MRGYIAGPMSGIRHFNFEAFDEAARVLRREGHDAISPAELDSPEVRLEAFQNELGVFKPGGETWGDFLARDVKLLADGGIEVIWVLPGWENSKGAQLETFIHAALLGKSVIDYATRREVSGSRLVSTWRKQFWSKHPLSQVEKLGFARDFSESFS